VEKKELSKKRNVVCKGEKTVPETKIDGVFLNRKLGRFCKTTPRVGHESILGKKNFVDKEEKEKLQSECSVAFFEKKRGEKAADSKKKGVDCGERKIRTVEKVTRRTLKRKKGKYPQRGTQKKGKRGFGGENTKNKEPR